ncbi:ComEA family DNA-binding protein [Sporomusa malonica]|uniref:Competence protein ComEA n=1 Tax=Sporomusa malonica TaxID=112901 RepID=A0A1W2D8R6_9FIRM|nr:ComEA family DNA-binding protein [Sporomusa malonica]SMC93576.1 competence protein ComEA [Sporomusa malonica]
MGILQKKLIIVIMLACGILAYSFHGFWQKSSDNQEMAAESLPPGNAAVVSTANNGTSNEVVVYVSGGVNKPGVYKFAHGSRVVDAVTMAGGFAPGADAARINLAMQLKDEMQVNVPFSAVPVSTTSGMPAVSNAGSNIGDRININTGSKADLDKLPGIGPALADRIIEYRTANGPFKDPTDIRKVPGIGESKYNQFKDKITL